MQRANSGAWLFRVSRHLQALWILLLFLLLEAQYDAAQLHHAMQEDSLLTCASLPVR